MSSSAGPLQYHRGSLICEAYELRITRRCLAEDLSLPADCSFSSARAHPIVKALETQRFTSPTGGKTVGPAAGDRTIYRLGLGHDHRGATWFDAQERVVWLCAYRLHRSGDPEDAFPYFHELIQDGRIMPTEHDYEMLFSDRDARFVETLPQDAQALLRRARLHAGVEQIGVLGGEQRAGVLVEVVETLQETYVAFSITGIDHTRLILILEAFYPEASYGDWELVSALPTRALQPGEFCYRIFRD